MSDRLQHVRRIAGRKGQITKLINTTRDAMQNNEDEKDVRSLQQKIEDARDVLTEEIFEYLADLSEEDKKEITLKKENEIEQIDSRIDDLNNEIKDYFKEAKLRITKMDFNKADISEETIHLERLNLPKFSGKDYFYWKSIFEVTVLAQPWSDKTKMLRLISCLEGEAKELIRNYPPVDASFHIALARLEDEYGGEKRMVSEAVKNIRKGKSVYEEDQVEIRRFITALESTRIVYAEHTSELDQAGALFYCARERLSPGLLRQYVQWCNTRDVSETFNSLIHFLSQWLKIIKDSKIEGQCKFKKYPITTYSQSVKNKSKDVGSNSSYKVHCAWHKKERNVYSEHYLNACDEFKALSVEQRRDFIFKNGLCFLCLKGNHTASQCKNMKGECRHCPKGNRHHFMLHLDRKEQKEPVVVTDSLESNNCHLQNLVSLQTVPLILKNGDRKVVINCLLDPGSNASFVTKSVVEELNLKDFGHEIRLLNTMNNSDQSISVSKVNLNIESLDGKVKRKVTVMTLADMLLKSKPLNWQIIKQKWPHLKNIQFPKLAERSNHEMLIGADLIFFHRSYKEVKGCETAPIAKLTPLGWTAVGPIDKNKSNNITLDIHLSELEDLTSLVKKQWELEAIGIQPMDDNICRRMSEEEKQAICVLDQDLRFKDEHYEAPILWKPGYPDLKNNYEVVLRRTQGMERRIFKDVKIFESCDKMIKSYLEKGYIKEISNDSKYTSSFYIPYFPIIKNDRLSTKCRLVFDCAAKYQGQSLNDQILIGPKLQNDIVNVMIRFRRYEYAVIGDISEMYLQIGLTPKDRKFCRFIFNDKIYEWSRLIFGRSDAPFVALHVLRDHAKKFKDQYPDVVDSIMKSMYIDDLCDSKDEPSGIYDLVWQSSEIFSKAGMDIKKWMTNCREVLATIPQHRMAKEVTNIFDDQLPTAKTLGQAWDVNSDDLYYTVNEITDFSHQPCTKRNILRSNARIFDPLGYLDPILITSKILFQRVWAAGIDWDQEVPTDIKNDWLQWYQQVKLLDKIRFPRYLGFIKNEEFSLHGFCDASKEAYSAVIYVRVKNKNRITSRLVISKSRVTPLRARSIPETELSSALILARLAKKTCQALDVNISRFTFWTDARNNLFWLKRPAKFYKPFVAHRIGEIQTITETSQWRHVPTHLNPADLPSRGCLSVSSLIDNQTWWNGPTFLTEDEENWPPNLVDESAIAEECLIPRQKVQVNVTVSICEADFPLNPVRWSVKRKLIKRLGYVLRFLTNTKLKREDRSLSQELSLEERKKAEDTLIRMCQQDIFPEEIKAIKEHQSIKKSSKLRKLAPFLDAQGLLRSRSRLEAIKWLNKEYKFPLILPEKHAVTRLIISEVHDEVGHALGMNATLAELNKRYWIIKSRVAVKRIQRSCMKCRIERAKPIQPQMAPLPSFRFEPPHQSFSKIAVDFAGPFETKSGRGKIRNKRYMALFTCLQTRAVHLEMVTSLDTSSFVNAFIRMSCRRGLPNLVSSDNGSTFRKAEKELNQQMLKNLTKLKEVSREPIKWNFNVPYGSHFGGVFEILIKSAKRALGKVLSNSDTTDEELQTAFCQVESILNSRPLTMTRNDIDDPESLPLTPNHFLIGRLDLTEMLQENDKREGLHPAKRWKYIQILVQHYWLRWQSEVLHSYKSRTKWLTETSNLKENDIVIVLDPINTGRRWKMGRITKVFPGFDKNVRVATVLVNGKEYRRPVNKLCPLELNHV